MIDAGQRSAEGRFLPRHGLTGSPEYVSWRAMVKRCTYPADKEYGRYKDVALHPEWRNSFEAFLRDVGPRPSLETLDRIDNSKGYVPGNVRWASRKKQSVNRTITTWVSDGEDTLCLADMARKHGVSRRTIGRWIDAASNKMERARD